MRGGAYSRNPNLWRGAEDESVVKDIKTRKKLPTADTRGETGYEAVSTPISIIKIPSPYDTG